MRVEPGQIADVAASNARWKDAGSVLSSAEHCVAQSGHALAERCGSALRKFQSRSPEV